MGRSGSHPIQRALACAAGLAFVLPAAACGAPGSSDPMDSIAPTGQEGQGGQETGDPSQPTARTSLPPGPVVVDGFHPTDLSIACSGDQDSLVEAIGGERGEIIDQCGNLGLLRARFPVGTVQELLEVRDRLRSHGIDASVIPVLDPGDLGTGSEGDPA